MATSANVKKDPNGKKLFFFSRYYDPGAKGTNIFNQELNFLERVYCFPPFPIIGMLLKHLEQQKINCVFHDDRTPSLSISLEHGGFKCFACNVSGDLVKFHMMKNTKTFYEAVNELNAWEY